MKKIDTARALRDPEYRNSLTDIERAMLPTHPAGFAAIADDSLRSVTGGCGPTACNNCGPTTFAWQCGTSRVNSCVGANEDCP